MKSSYRRAFAGVFALLLLFSTTAVVVSAQETVTGHPDLSVSAPNDEFHAGEDVTLELYVQNDGVVLDGGDQTYESRVQTARTTSLTVESGDAPVTVHTGTYPLGNVPQGVSGPYRIHLTIPDDAAPGTYSLPVRVSYRHTYAVHYDRADADGPAFTDRDRRKTLSVPITITEDSQFSVVDQSTNVLVNQRGTFSVALRNTGDETAHDAVIEVTSTNGDIVLGSDGGTASTVVQTWAPGATKRLTYDVRVKDGATVRNYTVPVSISYDDPDGITRTADDLVTVLRPGREQRFRLDSVTSSVRIGRSDGTVRGALVNDGPRTAVAPKLVVKSDQSGVSMPQRAYALPTLAPGERANFSFTVGTERTADLDSLPLDMAVEYQSEAGDEYTSDTLRTRLSVEPYRKPFDVEAVGAVQARATADNIESGSIDGGSWDALRLEITNHGDETLHDVHPQLVFDSQYFERPVASNNREGFIDTLEPGESKTVTISLAAAETIPGDSYPLTVRVDYERPNGVVTTSNAYTVPVQLERTQSFPLLPVGGGAVLVGGLLVGGVIWRRRSPE